MSKCKYFMNNICYSPYTTRTFGEPSSEPINTSYCLTDKYRECKYYVETGFETETDRLYEAIGLKAAIDFYPPVHLITCEQTSECPFYRQIAIDEEKHSCVASCGVSDRYLTRVNTKRCISNWRDCPFYKIGSEITS